MLAQKEIASKIVSCVRTMSEASQTRICAALPTKSTPLKHCNDPSQALQGPGKLEKVVRRQDARQPYVGSGIQHLKNQHQRKGNNNKQHLEDPNLLKLRSLASSCPFFPNDSSIWGE